MKEVIIFGMSSQHVVVFVHVVSLLSLMALLIMMAGLSVGSFKLSLVTADSIGSEDNLLTLAKVRKLHFIWLGITAINFGLLFLLQLFLSPIGVIIAFGILATGLLGLIWNKRPNLFNAQEYTEQILEMFSDISVLTIVFSILTHFN